VLSRPQLSIYSRNGYARGLFRFRLCAGEEAVKSLVSKRSIVIAGHKTSVSLEDEFWNSLKQIAGERGMTLTELVGAIDRDREHANLSSAIRLFVLGLYRDQRR
jgi:predicted DNA-binding ribbon-helix-helix protein